VRVGGVEATAGVRDGSQIKVLPPYLTNHLPLVHFAPRRAHTPKDLWEKIRLSRDYSKALTQLDTHLAYFSKHLIHRNKQRLTKIHQYLIRMRKLELKVKPKLVGVHKKVERREDRREVKALKAAKLEDSIEKELLGRLSKGTYGDIYNFPETPYNKALQKRMDEEAGGEGREEMEELEEKEMEEEELIEYVEDFDEEEDEWDEEDLEDMGGMEGTSSDEDDDEEDEDDDDEESDEGVGNDDVDDDVRGSKRKKGGKGEKEEKKKKREGKKGRVEIEYEEEVENEDMVDIGGDDW